MIAGYNGNLCDFQGVRSVTYDGMKACLGVSLLIVIRLLQNCLGCFTLVHVINVLAFGFKFDQARVSTN